MQIQIKAEPVGALRLLPFLPNARLAVLEGLNGIGKTLTVRLLQICTGTMPYRLGSPAWVSLCRGLGRFTIEVSGLAGVDSIIWSADTRQWESHQDVTALPFDQILIDGHTATITNVRRLFVVHRVAGDETLIETLAQQADAAEALVRRWAFTMRDAPNSPVSRLESEASGVIRLLGEWTVARHTDLVNETEDAQKALKHAKDEVDSAGARLREVEDLSGAMQQLERLRSVAPDLRNRIRVIDDRIATVRNELDRTQTEIVRLAERAARTEDVRKELANAQRTLKRNQIKLSSAFNSAASLAAELKLSHNRDVAVAERQSLQQVINELSIRQSSMDAAPPMRRLLDGISIQLADAEARGLSEQIAFDDPETDIQLTVRDTRLGVATRRAQLEGQPPAPEAREVAVQLRAAQDRLARVIQFIETLDEVARFRRLAYENEARVDRALSAIDPSALAELQRLEAYRRDRDAALLALAGERAALRQELGGLGDESVETLEARIKTHSRNLGVNVGTVSAAIEEARKRLQLAEVDLKNAKQDLTGLQREIARAEADVRRTIRYLAPSGELGWLYTGNGSQSLSYDHLSLPQQLVTIDRIRARVEAVLERLGKYRTQLGAVETALRGVGRHLRGLPAETAEYVPELEQYFSARFGSWFNSDKVRSELLREADGPIVVDVHEREVRWNENTRDRSRPLEAFSSGEQAFAYTRARLAILDEEQARAPNRLIVLDEFGAFIAHDRLAGLLTYLNDRVADHPGDQVLVILPLSHDYATEAENSIGRQRDELLRIAQQITSRRFAVRVLSQ